MTPCAECFDAEARRCASHKLDFDFAETFADLDEDTVACIRDATVAPCPCACHDAYEAESVEEQEEPAEPASLRCGACDRGDHPDCSGWCHCECEHNR